MRIVLICYDFPPVNRSASNRPFGWAKYWTRAGAEVKVVTTCRSRPGIPLNPEALYPDLKSIEVIEATHLDRLGWLTGKLTASNGEASSPAPNGGPDHSGFVRLKRRVRRALGALGGGEILSVTNLWIKPALNALLELHRRWPFEVVVSTFGPAACHVIAARARRQFDFFWVADYRDLWGGGDLWPARWPFNRLEILHETRTVRDCDLITTISEPFAKYLQERFPNKPVLTIENGFDPEERRAPAAFEGGSRRKRRLIYTGSIGLRHRHPTPILMALQSLRSEDASISERLEVIFHTPDGQALTALSEKWGLAGLVQWGGYLARSEILKAQRSADALLFLDWNNAEVEGVLTGKLFEYLNAGVPILSVGGRVDSEASCLISEHGFGLAFGNDIDAIKQFLRRWASGEAIPYQPDERLIERFSRSAQAANLLHEIRIRSHIAR